MKKVVLILIAAILFVSVISAACNEDTVDITSESSTSMASNVDSFEEVSSKDSTSDEESDIISSVDLSNTQSSVSNTSSTNQNEVIDSEAISSEMSSTNNSQTVYITKTGKKYHSSKYCSGLSNANAIYEASLSDAKNKGLGACSKCH